MKPSRPATQLLFLFDGPGPAGGERVSRAREPAPLRSAGPAPAVRQGSAARPGPVASLPPPADGAHRLVSELRGLVGGPVTLKVHDNRSTMVSFRREEGALHLRVHHMFLAAGPEVVRALADYARLRSARAGKVLDHYVRQHRSAIKPVDVEQARAKALRTLGEVHDLARVYEALNGRYFAGTLDARIGWGRGSTGRRRRSIRMGAYYHDTATILIHPALDRAEVPAYFVELVVFHEMLHQAVPHHRDETGRRCIHSPEFRARERQFHDFERARSWEKRNLALLLRPARPARIRPPGRAERS